MPEPIRNDPLINVTIQDYCLSEILGEGKIGKVYKAVREDPHHEFACKVIHQSKLKDGWQRELEKVVKLNGVPNVVQYHGHGSQVGPDHIPFIWIFWDYINGPNLKDYFKNVQNRLNLPFIEDVAKTLLNVLYACRAVDIQHGDLHEGNILIAQPDPRIIGSPQRIFVSDFGYGGSQNEVMPKEDFRQLSSIILSLMRKLDPSNLDPRGRIMFQKMEEYFGKKMLEVDHTQGNYVDNLALLVDNFKVMALKSEIESASASGEEIQGPGDYLVAEALGYRRDEWKILFVPEFLASQDLLSRNITILTGARGCGKTMVFRRLTAFMDSLIGEPSGVEGSEQFVGFYYNCRNLAEAFPWLPKKLNQGMQQQIMHYFNLSWINEITRTLAIHKGDAPINFAFYYSFLRGVFKNRYPQITGSSNVLDHARAFFEEEKERCRLADLGSKEGYEEWPLAQVDFVDNVQSILESNVPWINQKPLYFFLDDYTIPIIPREVQRVLNPIIFRRRSKLFFKVSTEATNSFDIKGLRDKPLEVHQDFDLIDLATESLHQKDKDKYELLEKIFKPRIDRHSLLRGKGLSMEKFLGKRSLSNNKLSWQMRRNAEGENRKRILYHGFEAFIGMWTSDIRIMIQMFTDMLREANGDLKKGKQFIEKDIQDKVYRTTGGEFLNFSEQLLNPSRWEKKLKYPKTGTSYGKHLRNIAEAFINISRLELTKGKIIPNQGQRNPKQAFRLEIVDKFELPDKVIDYYNGLIRWHIFLQDWRGKSVRGMVTPRLYLNRILIPFANLTFSSHDNIPFTNDGFISLLMNPASFYTKWKEMRIKRKGKRSGSSDRQANLFELNTHKE